MGAEARTIGQGCRVRALRVRAAGHSRPEGAAASARAATVPKAATHPFLARASLDHLSWDNRQSPARVTGASPSRPRLGRVLSEPRRDFPETVMFASRSQWRVSALATVCKSPRSSFFTCISMPTRQTRPWEPDPTRPVSIRPRGLGESDVICHTCSCCRETHDPSSKRSVSDTRCRCFWPNSPTCLPPPDHAIRHVDEFRTSETPVMVVVGGGVA